MKRTIALLFVFALLLVIVAPAGFTVNTQSVNTVFHLSVWADGGSPVPPLPDLTAPTAQLWADGGSPVPPLPDLTAPTAQLWTDGGSPVPPLPDVTTSTAQLWADGGSPVPPLPDLAPPIAPGL